MHLNNGGSNSVLSRLGYIFSLLLLIGILHQSVVSGSPLIIRDDDDSEPDDPNADVDTSLGGGSLFDLAKNYPDLEECKKKVSVPRDKSVFYSGVGRHEEKPQEFADQLPDGVLLREAFPKGFTDPIEGTSDSYVKFIRRASQAFAEASTGIVYVLLPTDGNTELKKKVWTKIEKPALIASGNVERILKVDPDDFSKKCVLWGSNDDNFAGCGDANGPIPGKSGGSAPAPTSHFTPGWCGVHVTQHQKENPNDPASHYHLDVTIFDAAGQEIGKVENQDAPSMQGVGVTSDLPWVLIVTAQNIDKEVVLFAYSDQKWGSTDQDHHCDFGAYDSGKREGDCGFTC